LKRDKFPGGKKKGVAAVIPRGSPLLGTGKSGYAWRLAKSIMTAKK